MAGGLCSDVFCSHCLGKNKYKELEDSCVSCVNLQHKLSEALTELSSAKYIIKLLEKDLSATSDYGNEPSSWYDMPHHSPKGGEISSSNLVSTQGPNNKWIPINPNQFTKPRKYSKDGNMPTGEHIITHNRYEPISNLIDLTTSNRSTKPIILKEVDKENLTASKQKHDNKIPERPFSTPNLQSISDPNPHQIKSQNSPTPGKCLPRNNPKIVIVGDSFAKGISGELKRNLRNYLEIIGYVRPGSSMEGITKLAKQEITSLTKKDMIVVWGGANDIARNEANDALTHIINYVEARKHTNVLIVSVPIRFDLISTSCVNK
jgi:hypothetical protein